MADVKKYPLGAVPSPVDHRDYRVMAAAPAATLPKLFMSGPMQPIRNQGQEGTCVGHALASGLMGAMQMVKPDPSTPFNRTLSVRDAYEGARATEPIPNGQQGAYPRAALKYAQRVGLCHEDDWVYHENNKGVPSTNADAHRALNRIASYAQVDVRKDALKAALMGFGPLLIVVPVTDGFYEPNTSGVVSNNGAFHGHHAVSIVGWDDALGFRLRNSWGTGWGQGGYCWLPFTHPIVEAWSALPSLSASPQPAPQPRPWWASFLPWLAP